MPQRISFFLALLTAALVLMLVGMTGCQEDSDSEPEPEPSTGTLTFTPPGLGTRWIEGQAITFHWTSADLAGNVSIELNRSYPSDTWETIIAGTPNDSTETWTVSLPATPTARARIISASYASIGDTIDYYVAIVSATTRAEMIPEDAVKITPETDLFPPVLHSNLWSAPVPLPGPVNTAGAEDSPVITPDGNNLFFFFTPDANVLPGLQGADGISGIWWSQKIEGQWSEPQRVLLFTGESLDSPFHVQGDVLWLGSARSVENYGPHDIYTVTWPQGAWATCQNAGALLNSTYDVGQLALTTGGETMYFDRYDSAGDDFDLYRTEYTDTWLEPAAMTEIVNTPANEGQPCLSPDNSEFWFMRDISGFGYPGPSLHRCAASDSTWADPEEILSQFSGDVAIDADGNLYFSHVFVNSTFDIIESDIYVCYRQ